jgi:small GTP-binding protein
MTTKETKIFPIAKVVVVGDDGVGKSSLVRRFCLGQFEASAESSDGIVVQAKIVEVNGLTLTLSVWDVAAKERADAVRETVLQNAHVVALVYDVTEPQSLEHLANWRREIVRLAPKVAFCIVGNKTDLKRSVLREHGEDWAGREGLLYAETSAKSGAGVEQLFLTLARRALHLV